MESNLATLAVPAAFVRQVHTVSHMGTKASLATTTPSGISAHETAQSVQTSSNRQVPETCQAGTRSRQGVGHALSVQSLMGLASTAKDGRKNGCEITGRVISTTSHTCCEYCAQDYSVENDFSCRKYSHRVLHAAKTNTCARRKRKEGSWPG